MTLIASPRRRAPAPADGRPDGWGDAFPPLPTLAPRERRALAALLARALAGAGPPLLHALLFGSKARGDFDDDSDVDVLLICDMDPADRQAAGAALAREADDVASAHGVAIEPWVVALADLEEGYRTPMLVDALADGLPLWPPGAPPIRLPFTPADALFCVDCLLDWVREGGTEAAAALEQGRWADAARRARDDISRLATAALLLTGDTRHRNAGSLRRFRRRFVDTGVLPPAILPALLWAESAYAAEPARAGERPAVTPHAAATAPAGCRLAAEAEALLVPWILERARATARACAAGGRGQRAATWRAAAPRWAPPRRTAGARAGS
ncbi:MAG TPA: nucleotidyltransferase domain-containing protein [Longimicrobiales bacterium]